MVETSAGNSDFLEVIKLNLRRNNDDYAEQIKHNSVQTASPSTRGFPVYGKQQDIKFINKLYGARKANIILEDDSGIQSQSLLDRSDKKPNKVNHTTDNVIDTSYTPEHISKQLIQTTKNILLRIGVNKQLSQQNTRRSSTTRGTVLTTHASPIIKKFSQTNKNRMQQFKAFINKNKDLFKEYVSEKKIPRTNDDSKDMSSLKMEIESVLAGNTKTAKEGDVNETVTYRTDALDMVNAKGGHIHAMRLRNRLCHRHVLIPEGPKYDSKGEIYLAAHAGRRSYNVTRRPRLLLPRCCNCCKKSVLGCM
ncbi:uncharacterized protein LOC126976192 [Leptidea sinapis]|uniref:uncharacterized protein LOC126976192 n=1 Tax=Leptidea sinapis TaxID=189913 RepID=UPI0021C3E0DF|nr:uncharacterized protein LOC126976192 [Leptidea sinapis]